MEEAEEDVVLVIPLVEELDHRQLVDTRTTLLELVGQELQLAKVVVVLEDSRIILVDDSHKVEPAEVEEIGDRREEEAARHHL